MFRVLAYICYAFAAADVILANTGTYDITGVVWSPLVAVALGYIFMKLHHRQS